MSPSFGQTLGLNGQEAFRHRRTTVGSTRTSLVTLQAATFYRDACIQSLRSPRPAREKTDDYVDALFECSYLLPRFSIPKGMLLTFFENCGHNKSCSPFSTMKTNALLAALLVATTVWLGQSIARAADEPLHVLYQDGRAAFYAGQFDVAREKLAKVLAVNPNHTQSRAMMAQIEEKLGKDNVMLRKSYEKIIIDKIEFADVELSEAILAVRMKAKAATQDKVIPNIILKTPEIGKKSVSLNLSNMPLSEVLNYLAQVAGVRISYDTSAVLFTSPAG